MALLEFDTSAAMTPGEKRSFASEVTDLYRDLLGADEEAVAVTVRARDDADLHVDRAEPGPVLVLQAHVDRERPVDRRREFARATMDAARNRWKIPERNLQVVFTEHVESEMLDYAAADEG